MAKPMPARGMNRGGAPGGDMPKARKGTMGRVVKLLMEDYKWPFLLAMLFMTLYSLGNISPSIFIKRISEIIIRHTASREWSTAMDEIVAILIFMVALLVVTIVCNYLYARLMAVITQGFPI